MGAGEDLTRGPHAAEPEDPPSRALSLHSPRSAPPGGTSRAAREVQRGVLRLASCNCGPTRRGKGFGLGHVSPFAPPPPPPRRPGFAPGRDVLLSVVRRFSYLLHPGTACAGEGGGGGAKQGNPNRRPNWSPEHLLLLRPPTPPGAAGQASLHTLVNRHTTAPCTRRVVNRTRYQVDRSPWEGRGGVGGEGRVLWDPLRPARRPSPNLEAKSSCALPS